jgi:CubicO group peptidase (beta-lactamase class C family)
MTSKLLMASASKFPAACAVAGAVADGHLTFDTTAAEVFPWWSAASSDPRSRVTLRQLLSFTSGFYWPDEAGTVPCMEGSGSFTVPPEQCAKQIYETAPFAFGAFRVCLRAPCRACA